MNIKSKKLFRLNRVQVIKREILNDSNLLFILNDMTLVLSFVIICFAKLIFPAYSEFETSKFVRKGTYENIPVRKGEPNKSSHYFL